MRKLVSVLLSACILFSTLIAVDIFATEIPLKTLHVSNFEEEQSAFYSSSKALNNTTRMSIVHVDDEHGKAVKFTRLGYFNGNVGISGEDWVRLCANDNVSDVLVEAGKTYYVSYDIKIVNSPNDVSVSLVIPTTTAGTNLYYSYTHTKVGWYAASTSGQGWKHYEGTFTAVSDGLLVMNLNRSSGTGWVTVEIYLDNITIGEYSDTVDVVYHYNQENMPDETVKTYEGSKFKVPEDTDEYRFAGWYMDSALTIPAGETVPGACEVWAKWEKIPPQQTVNTYDEEEITFLQEGNVTYFISPTGEKTDFSCKEKVQILETTDSSGKTTKALHFGYADAYTWAWPSICRIYDSTTLNPKFNTKGNGAYKITLKYKAEAVPSSGVVLQLIRVYGSLLNPMNGTYSADRIHLDNLATIKSATDGWVTVEAVFYTSAAAQNMPLAITCVSANSSKVNEMSLYIDDIVIEEQTNVQYITFNSNGGSSIDKKPCLPGIAIPELPIPKKENYYFDGWYKDAELTQPFDFMVMPEESITLYAKWSVLPDKPYALNTSFEPDEYEVTPYQNDGSNQNTNSDTISEYVTWHKNDAVNANDGKSYVAFDNRQANVKTNSSRWHALAVLNPDGSKYKILAGYRYRISYAYRAEGTTGGGQVVNLVTSQQTPVCGLNSQNVSILDAFTYRGSGKTGTSEGDWGIYENYIEAKSSGNVYLTFYTENDMQWICIDSLTIEPVSEKEVTWVRYYNEDGSKLIDAKLGKAGSKLIDATTSKTGYRFDGWRYADGTLFISSTFPKEDTDLYASFVEKDDLSKPGSINWSKDLKIDFEDSENVKKFYNDANNLNIALGEIHPVVNDPDGAHSGKNYYYFYKAGHWQEQYYRRVKLYTSGTSGNFVWLDPNSVYKVTYYIRVDDLSNAANLYLALFEDPESVKYGTYSFAAENYMSIDSVIPVLGEWQKYETTFVTGDNPAMLGFAMFGGYLTAAVDDITISKLREVTVSFESNGGSEVKSIVTLSQSYIVAPEDPVREGYIFKGWYTDRELTKPFSFNETMITDNITLYAKWEEIKAPEKKYKTVYDTEYVEEIVEREIEDAYLDEPLKINHNDKIQQKETGNDNQGNDNQGNDKQINNGNTQTIWLIVLIVVGGVLFIGLIVFAAVFVVKRNHKSA